MSRQRVKSTTCKSLVFLSEVASSPNVKIYFRFIRTSQLKLSYPRAQINLFAVKIVCSVEFSLNFENDRNHSRECFTEIWNLSIFNFIRDNICDPSHEKGAYASDRKPWPLFHAHGAWIEDFTSWIQNFTPCSLLFINCNISSSKLTGKITQNRTKIIPNGKNIFSKHATKLVAPFAVRHESKSNSRTNKKSRIKNTFICVSS